MLKHMQDDAAKTCDMLGTRGLHVISGRRHGAKNITPRRQMRGIALGEWRVTTTGCEVMTPWIRDWT